jgi:hypothetical protein
LAFFSSFQQLFVAWLIERQTWQNTIILFATFRPLVPTAVSKTDFLRSFFFGLTALFGALQSGHTYFPLGS